jgi:hypothetical protein
MDRLGGPDRMPGTPGDGVFGEETLPACHRAAEWVYTDSPISRDT